MTSGIEAVGDAATGGIIARAIEPSHGEGEGAVPGPCLNCGTALVGSYCHACGQNSHIHRTIAGFLHDLAHGVFHFEGKIWDTLPMLLFRPGELTRRYIAGERAKFVSPLAMFLFCTFLMFAVVGSLAGTLHAPQVDPRFMKMPRAELEKDLGKEEARAVDLRKQIKALDRADGDTRTLEAQLDKAESNIEGMKFASGIMSGRVKAGQQSDFQMFGGMDVVTGWPTLDRGIKSANANPDLFLYRLQTSAYKYSWLLIPISTPMVWLLFFWRRKYKFYDHLVFVTLSLTFMTLLVAVLTIAGALGLHEGLITVTAMLIPPVHMYKQMRGAYASGRMTALIRTVALIVFGCIALAIYLMILLALGVTH